MGRPSLASQRSEEILAAYTRCVGRYGLDGATLERVAQESGFSRGHIRHYLGNREELREKFLSRLIGRYTEQTRVVYDAAEPGTRSVALVHYFFGPDFEPNDDNAAIDATMGAATYDETLRTNLRTAYLGIESTVHQALREDFPGAPAAIYRSTAYQLFTLVFGHWGLMELGFPTGRTRAGIGLALELIDSVRRQASESAPRNGGTKRTRADS